MQQVQETGFKKVNYGKPLKAGYTIYSRCLKDTGLHF